MIQNQQQLSVISVTYLSINNLILVLCYWRDKFWIIFKTIQLDTFDKTKLKCIIISFQNFRGTMTPDKKKPESVEVVDDDDDDQEQEPSMNISFFTAARLLILN